MHTKLSKTMMFLAACMVSLIGMAQVDESATAMTEMAMPPEMQAMMEAFEQAAKTGPQHAMLAESVGDWTATVSMWMDPSAPPEVSQSEVTRKLELDGRVVEEVWQGSMMGQPFTGIGRTGYDNVTGKYWSTWTDNMSTAVMLMHGDYDAESKTFTFHGDYTDPMSKQKVTTRTVLTTPEAGKEVMTMYELHDGEESKTMQIEMQRK
jgi:hypothetical protein